jgi:hypothetical protein
MAPDADRLVMSFAAGVSDHRGWLVVVCVGARGGVPFVADRRRVELVDDGVERQPFHHAAPDATAAEVVPRVAALRAATCARAGAGLADLRDRLGGPLVGVAIEEESRTLPDSTDEILESQQLRIAADAGIYRDAVRVAAEKLGAEVMALPRASELGRAAEALEAREDEVDALLARLGRELGPPWRKEHRKAAAMAIAALGAKLQLKL